MTLTDDELLFLAASLSLVTSDQIREGAKIMQLTLPGEPAILYFGGHLLTKIQQECIARGLKIRED